MSRNVKMTMIMTFLTLHLFPNGFLIVIDITLCLLLILLSQMDA